MPAIYKVAFSEKTKIAELKLAAFIAEHSAIQTVDHLTNILPQLDTSSDTMSSFKLHRTKCAMLIKNELGPAMLTKLLEDIGNFPFSITVDESTDHSTQKVLCIMLRFFSLQKRQMVTTFYRLIKLVEIDAKAIHSDIKSQLETDGLNENMVGIGVDGASIMVGKYNSVTRS